MIQEVTVENFKSLKSVSLKLGQRNVLVGPNLSGKSNLIQVFRLLTRMVTAPSGAAGLSNAIQPPGAVSDVWWKGKEQGPISIRLVGSGEPFANLGSDARWSYHITVAPTQWGFIQVQDESLRVDTSRGECRLIENVAGQRKIQTRDGRSLSSVPEAYRSALEFEIPDWEGDALRRFFRSTQFHQLIPAVMRQLNQSVAANFLTEHGDNLASWLMTLQTKHGASFERIARVARDAFPSLERLFTVPTQQGQVFLASQERYLTGPVSIFQMSDGELAFIALLSLIFSPLEYGALLHCVEEPENYLHPRLLATLATVLKQAQEELLPEQRAQIVIATHSPYVVDQFSLDELIVLQKHQGATVVIRPSDKVHLRDLLKSEEIGLGELFYSGALSGE
jgi:predicted ATPase